MDSKTPLRLKLKLTGGSSTPEPDTTIDSTTNERMADDDIGHVGSEEDMDEDEYQDDAQQEDVALEEEENYQNQQNLPPEDASRERHKKSKKKKKKKEREKHKHKHHREKTEADDQEPALKKQHLEVSCNKPSKAAIVAFKELLEYLSQHLQKKDTQNFFAFPVTDAIAPGYSSIIPDPMDFSRINQKIKDNLYTCLSEFKTDIKLICSNCMIYNQPETIYYKAAKKLLHAAEKNFAPEKILQLRKDIPDVMTLTKDQLGFDINSTSIIVLETGEGSRDSMKTSDNENSQDQTSRFEAIQDEASAEEILEQSQKASKEAAERLTDKKPTSTLGFLRQRKDGTTTLNFLTGCEGNDPNQKEKTVNLGLLTGKLNQGQGTFSLNNYRDDKRSMAKPVKPLYYGAFSSFCPSYDSTFANLTKEESEMVFATYGNEAAVQYAESICDFSRDCDIAMQMVDHLLNILTHKSHSRTKAMIEERKRVQQEEQKINALFSQGDTKSQNAGNVDFASLRSLSDMGIDTTFLNTFEKLERKEKTVGIKLEENAILIDCLAKEQKERLSKPLPSNLNNLPLPNQNEIRLAEKVTEGLISVARQVNPGAIAPVPTLRRALGITMMPVVSESTEQIEVDIEGTYESSAIHSNHN